MPESRSRRSKRPSYIAPTPKSGKRPSPRWWAPVMVGLMVLGLIWAVVSYIAQGDAPIPGIGATPNLLIGLGLLLVGFGMTPRWR